MQSDGCHTQLLRRRNDRGVVATRIQTLWRANFEAGRFLYINVSNLYIASNLNRF